MRPFQRFRKPSPDQQQQQQQPSPITHSFTASTVQTRVDGDWGDRLAPPGSPSQDAYAMTKTTTWSTTDTGDASDTTVVFQHHHQAGGPPKPRTGWNGFMLSLEALKAAAASVPVPGVGAAASALFLAASRFQMMQDNTQDWGDLSDRYTRLCPVLREVSKLNTTSQDPIPCFETFQRALNDLAEKFTSMPTQGRFARFLNSQENARFIDRHVQLLDSIFLELGVLVGAHNGHVTNWLQNAVGEIKNGMDGLHSQSVSAPGRMQLSFVGSNINTGGGNVGAGNIAHGMSLNFNQATINTQGGGVATNNSSGPKSSALWGSMLPNMHSSLQVTMLDPLAITAGPSPGMDLAVWGKSPLDKLKAAVKTLMETCNKFPGGRLKSVILRLSQDLAVLSEHLESISKTSRNGEALKSLINCLQFVRLALEKVFNGSVEQARLVNPLRAVDNDIQDISFALESDHSSGDDFLNDSIARYIEPLRLHMLEVQMAFSADTSRSPSQIPGHILGIAGPSTDASRGLDQAPEITRMIAGSSTETSSSFVQVSEELSGNFSRLSLHAEKRVVSGPNTQSGLLGLEMREVQGGVAGDRVPSVNLSNAIINSTGDIGCGNTNFGHSSMQPDMQQLGNFFHVANTMQRRR